MKRRSFIAASAAAAALPGAIGTAQAQKAQNTLRVTWRDAVPDVDPYRNSLRTGLVVSHEAWDMLAYRDPETFKNVPALATGWTQVDPLTLEFTLRDGVKFHNGDAFGADDVVYTIQTIQNDPKVAVPSNFSFWSGAEKINDHQVRLKLKAPFPAALEYLAMLTPIYPKMYREKVGPEGYSKAPVGTGPYRITRVNGSSSIEFERFEGYYAGAPKPKPAIKNLKIMEVLDAASELSAFIGGQTDWIWNYNPRPVRQPQHAAGQDRGARRLHATRLLAARRGGPQRCGQSAHQSQGAPSDLSRHRPQRHRAQFDAGRQPPGGRALLPEPVRLQPISCGCVRLRPCQGQGAAEGGRVRGTDSPPRCSPTCCPVSPQRCRAICGRWASL